jgi:hypothetical protein
MVLSSAALGPANAAGGLAAGGDVNGDAAVAWVQGSGASAAIVVAQLYQAPAPVVASTAFRYVRRARVLLSWTPQRASWGPITYTVSVDGAAVGQTGATSFTVPTLPDGPHTWQVTAGNPAGLSSTMSPARVFVDTTAPRVSLALTGARTVGATMRITVKATDAPPGVPRSRASGIATVTVFWGDRSPRAKVVRGKASHVYKRAGRYKLRVVVQDRAGNTTAVTRILKILVKAPPAKPTPGKPTKG